MFSLSDAPPVLLLPESLLELLLELLDVLTVTLVPLPPPDDWLLLPPVLLPEERLLLASLSALAAFSAACLCLSAFACIVSIRVCGGAENDVPLGGGGGVGLPNKAPT